MHSKGVKPGKARLILNLGLGAAIASIIFLIYFEDGQTGDPLSLLSGPWLQDLPSNSSHSKKNSIDLIPSDSSHSKKKNSINLIPSDSSSHSKRKNSIVKKRAGEGWAMWDREKPIVELEGLECLWTTFRTSGAKPTPMCVHRVDDIYVSKMIRQSGRWRECDALTSLWNKNPKPEPSIYVEVGANIGSCVMQMLLTTNATIYAFEPHPRNLFCLTSTLMGMGAEYRNRVSLFPIALGSEAGSSTINAAKDNWGNSVVGKVIKDQPSQQFDAAIPIRIERLDSILDMGSNDDHGLHVPLMKMDAQGFECFIVDGMPSVLARTQTIKTEVQEHFLSEFDGCSAAILMDKLGDANFDIFLPSGKLLKGPPPSMTAAGFDIVAEKQSRKTD